MKNKRGVKWGEKTFEALKSELKPGDVLLTIGAGDVWKWGEQYLREGTSLSQRLLDKIPTLRGSLKAEEPLSRHCTWAIGGPAEVYVEVHNLRELKAIQEFCGNHHTPFFILGWGSNVLLPDEGLRGCVVRLRKEFESIEFDGPLVKVGAGVHLPKLAKRCAEKGLAGMEGLCGVPGTIGGALMTNAGTPRGVIGDIVKDVQVLEADGAVKTLTKDDIQMSYRSSNLIGKWIVGATLELRQVGNGSVAQKIKEELESRARTQPLGTKNVGSIFKNPPNDHAARLIEAVGLKGKQLGRVRISPKHANFIENIGGATAREAKELIELARKKVKEKFNIELQPEVKIIHSRDFH